MKGIDFDYEIQTETGVYLFRVTDFYPEHPAPACSNPDSPRFSDPGDPVEYECEVFYLLEDSGLMEELPERVQLAIIELYNGKIIAEGMTHVYNYEQEVYEEKMRMREDY